MVDNIAYVDEENHRRYHALFKERMPDEIITYLVRRFWNNQWEWVERALNKHYACEAYKGVRNEKGVGKTR